MVHIEKMTKDELDAELEALNEHYERTERQYNYMGGPALEVELTQLREAIDAVVDRLEEVEE